MQKRPTPPQRRFTVFERERETLKDCLILVKDSENIRYSIYKQFFFLSQRFLMLFHFRKECFKIASLAFYAKFHELSACPYISASKFTRL